MNKKDIKKFTQEELTGELSGMDKRRFRAKQIFKWVFKKDVRDFSEMTNLTKPFRKELDEKYYINRFELIKTQTSDDGTKKLLFQLHDNQRIETVLIPGPANRTTLCVSTQIGCKLGCLFCRTGAGGFSRDLTTGEIVEQVLASKRELNKDERISNVVFMGMGEPLLNYDNTVRAIKIFYDDDAFNFSVRKITLSTAGIPHMIEKLGEDIELSLAISLHAVDNEKRTFLMPINRKYPLESLFEACKNYPLGPRRRITFEYLLIKDINDSDDHAKKLAKLLAPLKSKVNLIVFNPFDGCDFERPSDQRVEAFQNILIDRHVHTMVRKSRGEDILAACGQLRAESGYRVKG